jgi:hypothetical protein
LIGANVAKDETEESVDALFDGIKPEMPERSTDLKVGNLLSMWYGFKVKFELERVKNGYEAFVSANDKGKLIGEMIFVSDDLIASLDSKADNQTSFIRSQVSSCRAMLNRWHMTAAAWNNKSMNVSSLSTQPTYRRYFGLSDIPIRKI